MLAVVERSIIGRPTDTAENLRDTAGRVRGSQRLHAGGPDIVGLYAAGLLPAVSARYTQHFTRREPIAKLNTKRRSRLRRNPIRPLAYRDVHTQTRVLHLYGGENRTSSLAATGNP